MCRLEPSPPPPIDLNQLKAAIRRKVAGKARVATFNIPQGTRQSSTSRKASQLGNAISANTPIDTTVEADDDDVRFEVLRRSAGKLDRRRNRGHEGPLSSRPKGFA